MKKLNLLLMQYPGQVRLSLDQLATCLKISPITVRNRIQLRTFPIRAFRDSHGPKGRLFFSIEDVADFLESQQPIRRRGRPTKSESIAAAQG